MGPLRTVNSCVPRTFRDEAARLGNFRKEKLRGKKASHTKSLGLGWVGAAGSFVTWSIHPTSISIYEASISRSTLNGHAEGWVFCHSLWLCFRYCFQPVLLPFCRIFPSSSIHFHKLHFHSMLFFLQWRLMLLKIMHPFAALLSFLLRPKFRWKLILNVDYFRTQKTCPIW